MSDDPQLVERRLLLPAALAARLHQFAGVHRTSEDAVVGRALDILFSLTDLLDGETELRMWSALSSDALARVWDNDEDARYDNWRDLYGVSTG